MVASSLLARLVTPALAFFQFGGNSTTMDYKSLSTASPHVQNCRPANITHLRDIADGLVLASDASCTWREDFEQCAYHAKFHADIDAHWWDDFHESLENEIVRIFKMPVDQIREDGKGLMPFLSSLQNQIASKDHIALNSLNSADRSCVLLGRRWMDHMVISWQSLQSKEENQVEGSKDCLPYLESWQIHEAWRAAKLDRQVRLEARILQSLNETIEDLQSGEYKAGALLARENVLKRILSSLYAGEMDTLPPITKYHDCLQRQAAAENGVN